MPNSRAIVLCSLPAAQIALLVCLIAGAANGSDIPRRIGRVPTDTSTRDSATPHPAVCRVIATSGTSISYGSGSLIAVNERLGVVITNWHVVNEATGQISVVFPDGFHSPARVLKINRDWDLAVLSIWRPSVDPISLSQTAPQRGDSLTIAGYGSGKYRAATGNCTQYVSPGRQLPFEMVELSVAARQGDSGGPILNQRGELAGVLFGAGTNTTTGSYVGRVRWFLESAGVPLDDERTMIASRPRTAPHDSPAKQHSASPANQDLFPRQAGVPLVQDKTSSASAVAATTTPEFRTPHVSAPARVAASAEIPQLRWQDIAGESLFAQIKTVLAVVGLFSLLAMGLRRSS